jgi:hypothetical protein
MSEKHIELRLLLESNSKKLDKSGYIQLEKSVVISPNNQEIPQKYVWIDGVQLVSLHEKLAMLTIWVSAKDSEEIYPYTPSKFSEEELSRIINELKKTLGID